MSLEKDNGEFHKLRNYNFILKHPIKIDDVLNPAVRKKIRKLRDEETEERYFLVELAEETSKVEEISIFKTEKQ